MYKWSDRSGPRKSERLTTRTTGRQAGALAGKNLTEPQAARLDAEGRALVEVLVHEEQLGRIEFFLLQEENAATRRGSEFEQGAQLGSKCSSSGCGSGSLADRQLANAGSSKPGWRLKRLGQA